MGLFGLPKIDKLKQRGNTERLNKALDSRYPWEVRVDAALALTELGDDRGRREFATILGQLGSRVRAGRKDSIGAATALASKGDKAVGMLSGMLADSKLDIGEHEGAVMVLGMIGSDRSQDALMDCLDKYPDHRSQMATEVLKKVGSERLVDRLVGWVNDPNAKARIDAIKILGAIGSARATDCLIRALAEDNEYVSRRAADALGHIGDSRAVGPLIDKLGANNCLRNDSPSQNAAKALIRIGESAVAPLVQALSNAEPFVRMGAAYALAYLRASDAVPALIKVLEGPDGQASGRMREGDWLVARLACDALRAIGDRRAVPALKAVTANAAVREDAEKALAALA